MTDHLGEAVEPSRQLSRQEAHDLGMIIKERAKVLKSAAQERSAVLLADFERQMAAEYNFDDDEVWKKATTEAAEAVKIAQKIVERRCTELGIPKAFAPQLSLSWQQRGENLLSARRVELRRVAKAAIDAMERAAYTKIDKQALDLRATVVAKCMLSPDARLFLESLAPVEEAMRQLDFQSVHKDAEQTHQQRLERLGRFINHDD